jgi:C-terminal processing protease CtpA/Prc
MHNNFSTKFSKSINAVKKILIENYIFPEVSKKINNLLDTNFKKGNYKKIVDPKKFAKKLTKDVQSFNDDKHLRVLFEPKRIAERKVVVSAKDSILFEKKHIENLKKKNYYFEEIKILEGNIGYLNLKKFRDPYYAGKATVAAMNFLSNTDAIIIDLRQNGGGTPKMVQLISSYFFGSEVVLLNTVFKRKENIIKQFWTLPYVPGKKMPNVPLYILTSSRTFSAAEEFSYNLQNLKRALIIGETTGGGAHPGGRINATEKYNVWTPTARSISPITKTNWENVGVIPDIKTTKEKAFKTAYVKALRSLKNNSTQNKKWYEEIIQKQEE